MGKYLYMNIQLLNKHSIHLLNNHNYSYWIGPCYIKIAKGIIPALGGTDCKLWIYSRCITRCCQFEENRIYNSIASYLHRQWKVHLPFMIHFLNIPKYLAFVRTVCVCIFLQSTNCLYFFSSEKTYSFPRYYILLMLNSWMSISFARNPYFFWIVEHSATLSACLDYYHLYFIQSSFARIENVQTRFKNNNISCTR